MAVVAAVAALGAVTAVATGAGTAPAPCNNTPQIGDAVGDGHHSSSDVTAAWFSEASGNLQAVIQVRTATWVAEHDDAQVEGAAFAMLFQLGGQTRYVRATDPGPDHPTNPMVYDYGTYTLAGGFVSAGPTTGSTVVAALNGTVTIDVPAAIGAVAGVKLASPYVLTYDGIKGSHTGWGCRT